MNHTKHLMLALLTLYCGIGNIDCTSAASFHSEYVKILAPEQSLKIKIVGCDTPNYDFKMSKYEVTNIEYTDFLNSVAKIDDPHQLYSPLMTEHFWGGITRAGAKGEFVYKVKRGYELLPVTFVSWRNAIRFANWLDFGRPNTGISDVGTTEGTQFSGAYNTSDKTTPRNPHAKYFIPTCGEWIISGFYDNKLERLTSYVGGDTPPNSGPPTYGSRSANYYENKWALPYPHLASANSYENNTSNYGTYNQAGNVMEWVDTAKNNHQAALGGSLFMPQDTLNVNYRDSEQPDKKLSTFGFRVAKNDKVSDNNLTFFAETLDFQESQSRNAFVLDLPISWTLIDKPGNFSDIATGSGCVAYPFEIMKNMISNSDYAFFLNAVAQIDDPHNLYIADMSNGVAGGITRTSINNKFIYAAKPGYDNRPVAYMSWFSLARYANWHHFKQPTGSQVVGVTEGTSTVGAYDTSFFDAFNTPRERVVDDSLFKRNHHAEYFIPTDDEWYKAAYYDPSRFSLRKYWNYPNRSNSSPINIVHSKGSANYQIDTLGEGPPFFTSEAGAFSNGGYYDVNDLGGNLWEWTEDWRGLGGGSCWRCDIPTKGLRGGSFNYISTGLKNTNIDPGFPADHYFVYGGRLARKVVSNTPWSNWCLPASERKGFIDKIKYYLGLLVKFSSPGRN